MFKLLEREKEIVANDSVIESITFAFGPDDNGIWTEFRRETRKEEFLIHFPNTC